ncbi:serine/threonine-protein kinase [Streptomyces sp. RFCAC02]|uniref:serine/threonine-protein kinase n=1 Tax=Streptomyces sp. RFCAC02 TaxID=2499143 RepID=UPI001F0F02F1|nr:serine/threonine-protein kinase [Streptomyces sp. RFCAC02]
MEDLRDSDPRELGPYRPRAVLGEGGMGRVLLATGAHGRLVAIKRVHDHLAADDDFRRRFRREVAASRRVVSARTAAVVGADTETAVPWLASEFVHGPSLHEALDEVGSLPEETVLRLAAGLAAALRDIHAAGLAHRDLSPSNVLLADDGPRVLDFGIVRAVEGRATSRMQVTTTVTHTGMVIGTPAFMSPEQAEGRKLTSATDMFSLGTMLLLASTGTNPFEGRGIPQTLYNVVHLTPDLDAVPERLRALIEPCLAKEPAERPAPARLLELVGPVADTDRPWPAEVHRLTERQRAEIRGRVPLSHQDTAGPGAPPAPPMPPLVPPHILSAPEPDPLTVVRGPGRGPGGPGAGSGVRGKRVVLAVLAATALVLGAVAISEAITDDGGPAATDSAFDRPATDLPTTDDATDDGYDESWDDGSWEDDAPAEDEEPTPEPETESPAPESPAPEEAAPPDPTLEAYRSVGAGECLHNWMVSDTAWSSDVPETVSCDAEGVAVWVTLTTDDAGDCPVDAGRSYLTYSSGGETVALCVTRLFEVGQCFLGMADGSANLMSWADCYQGVPAPYSLLYNVTAVYSAPADPTGAECRQSAQDQTQYQWWSPDGGRVLLCAVVL